MVEASKSIDHKPIDPHLAQNPAHYMKVYREEIDRLVSQEAKVGDIVNYSESNIRGLFQTLEQQKTAATKRLRNWLYVAGGAGLLALGVAVGTAVYQQRALIDEYNGLVRNWNKAVVTSKEQGDNLKNLEAQLGEKDNMLTDYEGLFEKVFGKPPEKKTEATEEKSQ